LVKVFFARHPANKQTTADENIKSLAEATRPTVSGGFRHSYELWVSECIFTTECTAIYRTPSSTRKSSSNRELTIICVAHALSF